MKKSFIKKISYKNLDFTLPENSNTSISNANKSEWFSMKSSQNMENECSIQNEDHELDMRKSIIVKSIDLGDESPGFH